MQIAQRLLTIFTGRGAEDLLGKERDVFECAGKAIVSEGGAVDRGLAIAAVEERFLVRRGVAVRRFRALGAALILVWPGSPSREITTRSVVPLFRFGNDLPRQLERPAPVSV